MVLIKQHVSAYSEGIIRFFLCWLQETINNAWLDVEISSSADMKHYTSYVSLVYTMVYRCGGPRHLARMTGACLGVVFQPCFLGGHHPYDC